MNRSLLALPLLALATASAGGCVIKLGGTTSNGITLDEEAQRAETHALALAPGETLDLRTTYGGVEVSATSDGRSELRATLRASGRTLEEAQAVLARYALVIERGPNGPVVRLQGEPLTVHEDDVRLQLSAHVDYSATVPAGTALSATTSSGDIRASGVLAACRLETTYGEIALEEARGDVTAKSGSGDVSAGRVEGSQVELASGYGSVRLDEVKARRVSCTSGSGDIELGATEAEALELSTNYGDVSVRDCTGNLHVRTGSGDVRLRGVRGAIDAESSYGTIEIDGEFTGLRARSGSGEVSARATESSRIESDWTLSSSYGSVALSVPDGFGCVLDAKTSYGNVACDFPITVEAGNRKDDRQLRGTVGSGGGAVTLSSGSGGVSLKKLGHG